MVEDTIIDNPNVDIRTMAISVALRNARVALRHDTTHIIVRVTSDFS